MHEKNIGQIKVCDHKCPKRTGYSIYDMQFIQYLSSCLIFHQYIPSAWKCFKLSVLTMLICYYVCVYTRARKRKVIQLKRNMLIRNWFVEWMKIYSCVIATLTLNSVLYPNYTSFKKIFIFSKLWSLWIVNSKAYSESGLS